MRSVKEWVGKTDDTPIPPRVKDRIRERAYHRCENCGVHVPHGGEVDHVLAIILGGANAESNLRFLCRNCHGAKTKTDLVAKSRSAKARIKVAGFKPKSQLAKKWAWAKRVKAERLTKGE